MSDDNIFFFASCFLTVFLVILLIAVGFTN